MTESVNRKIQGGMLRADEEGSGYCVIFDMDGVIFDTERFFMDCCLQAARRYRLADMEQVCYACIGLTEPETRKYMRAFYGDDAPLDDFRQEVSRIFDARYAAEGFALKPGIRQLLTWLRERHTPTALASSTKTHLVRRELQDAGLLDYFDVVIGGDMVRRSKPAPDIFLRAAEGLQVQPAACYVIEDSFKGIRAAHAAGMHPLMVPDLLQPEGDIPLLAEGIFPSLVEVLEYLRERALPED